MVLKTRYLKDFIFEEIKINNERKNKVGRNFKIPCENSYEDLKKSNFSIEQFKIICNHYNLRKTGNKALLGNRIYNYLKYSNYVKKIQKVYRGFLQRKFILNCGPAIFNKSLCNNVSDFLSMDKIEDVKYPQFYSFEDKDNKIYGFDIISLYNLILKEGVNACNPYNRSPFPSDSLVKLKNHISQSKKKYITESIKIDIPSNIDELSYDKQFELKVLDIFQHINSLGNYADEKWVLNMNRANCIIFMRELYDVWGYRLQIDNETKLNICPPNGNPFSGINLNELYNFSCSQLKRMAVLIIERLTKQQVRLEFNSLGAFYVLGTLTLINSEARSSLPWLYQSFVH
jgi:hypothetical protein